VIDEIYTTMDIEYAMARIQHQYIQGRADFFQLLGELLPRARDLLRATPEFGPYSSIVRQLEAISEWTSNGREPTRDERAKITIGRIIAREFEPADPNEDEYGDKLSQLGFYFAHWLEDPEWLALDDADLIATYFPASAAQSQDADTPAPIRLRGSVFYPTLKSEHGDAHFLRDPESGTQVWVPAGMSQQHLVYTGETRDELAHGEGKATLGVIHDPRPLRLEGCFRDGVFLGEEGFDDPLIMLPRNDYLVGLPSPRDSDAQFWLRNGLGANPLVVAHHKDNRCDLVIVAPTGTSALEVDLLRDLIIEAAKAARDRGMRLSSIFATVVPQDWALVRAKYGAVKFDRDLCSGGLYETDEHEFVIQNYQNEEAKAAERVREKEEKDAAYARGERNALLRGRGSDVRGLKLGMRIEQMVDLLESSAREWGGLKETPEEDKAFGRPVVTVKLEDGAEFQARFTSRQTGSELFLLSYKQNYREGVSTDELVKALEDKYGPPDEVKQRESGTYWATYQLVSGISPPGRAHGPHGAYFKTHVRSSGEARTAEVLTIVFNDATLSDHDESEIFEARKQAARRKHEQGKSKEIKL
jgi:hypothetical protein